MARLVAVYVFLATTITASALDRHGPGALGERHEGRGLVKEALAAAQDKFAKYVAKVEKHALLSGTAMQEHSVNERYREKSRGNSADDTRKTLQRKTQALSGMDLSTPCEGKSLTLSGISYLGASGLFDITYTWTSASDPATVISSGSFDLDTMAAELCAPDSSGQYYLVFENTEVLPFNWMSAWTLSSSSTTVDVGYINSFTYMVDLGADNACLVETTLLPESVNCAYNISVEMFSPDGNGWEGAVLEWYSVYVFGEEPELTLTATQIATVNEGCESATATFCLETYNCGMVSGLAPETVQDLDWETTGIGGEVLSFDMGSSYESFYVCDPALYSFDYSRRTTENYDFYVPSPAPVFYEPTTSPVLYEPTTSPVLYEPTTSPVLYEPTTPPSARSRPSNMPSAQLMYAPTSVPTFAPYFEVEASSAMVLGGFASPDDFTSAYKTAFKRTIVDVCNTVDSTNQVKNVIASLFVANQRRLSAQNPGEIQVDFTVTFVVLGTDEEACYEVVAATTSELQMAVNKSSSDSSSFIAVLSDEIQETNATAVNITIDVAASEALLSTMDDSIDITPVAYTHPPSPEPLHKKQQQNEDNVTLVAVVVAVAFILAMGAGFAGILYTKRRQEGEKLPLSTQATGDNSVELHGRAINRGSLRPRPPPSPQQPEDSSSPMHEENPGQNTSP